VAAWRDCRFELIVSPRLINELSEVLARSKFSKWSGDGRGQSYAAAFAAGAMTHDDPPTVPATRDPDDDHLVALARSAGADVIVSVDHDLLDADLVGLVVLSPADFISHLVDSGG